MSMRAMPHLLWKDFRLAVSLLIAGVAGILLLFPISHLVVGTSQGNSDAVAYALWAFLPFLIAIGAPPTLVGHENERGTLDWLRTLPVSWQSHLGSKLIIAIGGWFLVYSLACVALYLSLGGIERDRVGNAFSFLAPLMFFLPAILLGFVFSFVFRNGLVSAIASLFGSLVAWFLFVLAMDLFKRFVELWIGVTLGWAWALTLTLTALLTILIFVMCWLARRRIAGTSDELFRLRAVRRHYRVKRPLAFKPNAAVHLRYSFRARPATALLWQQFCQTGWLLLGCLVVGTFASLGGFGILLGGVGFDFTPLTIALVNLVCCTLGVSCFHGERLFNRAGFFADRGVGTFPVWWSRLFLAAVVATFLCLITLLSQALSDELLTRALHERVFEAELSVFLVTGPAICFLIGVLVGQCGSRAMLAYFSAPMLAIFWIIPVQWIFNLYPQFLWWLWPSLLVLVLATYRLTRFVMENRTGLPVIGRGIAYGALAWLVVSTFAGVQVYRTTPSQRPEVTENLRLAYQEIATQMIDEDLRQEIESESLVRYATDTNGPIQFYDYQVDTRQWSDEDFANSTIDKLRRMPKDLVIAAIPDPDISPEILRGNAFNQQLSMAEHLSNLRNQREVVIGLGNRNQWLTKFVRSTLPEQRTVAIEIALREAALARQGAFQGMGMDRLLRIAEVNERLGLFGLQQWMKELDPADAASFQRLVALIPSEKMRKESRRYALLNDWHRFDSGDWRHESRPTGIQSSKTFVGLYFEAPRYDLGIERTRATRNIDQGTWLLLRQLESGLPSIWDAELVELKSYWREAFRPFGSHDPGGWTRDDRIPSHLPIFVREHELLIERMRAYGQSLSTQTES